MAGFTALVLGEPSPRARDRQNRLIRLGRHPKAGMRLAIKKPASYGSSDAHVYKVPPRKDHRGVDLISDALPFSRLWYGEPNESRRTNTRAISKNADALPILGGILAAA